MIGVVNITLQLENTYAPWSGAKNRAGSRGVVTPLVLIDQTGPMTRTKEFLG